MPGTGSSLEVSDQLQSDKYLSWTRPRKGIIQVKANYVNETKESRSGPIRSVPVSSHLAPVHKRLCDHQFPICIWLMWDAQLSCYLVDVARLITSGADAAEMYRSRVEKRTAWTCKVEKGGGEREKPLSEPEVSRRRHRRETEMAGGSL